MAQFLFSNCLQSCFIVKILASKSPLSCKVVRKHPKIGIVQTQFQGEGIPYFGGCICKSGRLPEMQQSFVWILFSEFRD